MSDRFNVIKSLYEQEFEKHGDAPASLLTPKGRQDLRFRSIDEYLNNDPISVLDYGCGLGYLYQYLRPKYPHIKYTGVDIVSPFIEECQKKFIESPNAKFINIQPDATLSGAYDIVFASGVFNIQMKEDKCDAKEYTFARLKELFSVSNKALICDFLSPYVDFEQSGSLHFQVNEIADFCSKNLSRRFLIRHDLLPYEFTMIALKDDRIKRPDNFFEEDSDFVCGTK